MTAVAEVRGLTKRYGSVTAVDDASFVLEEHKVFIGRVALRFEQLNGPTHKGRPSSY